MSLTKKQQTSLREFFETSNKVENFSREMDKWNEIKVGYIISIKNNPFFTQYYIFGLNFREKVIDAKKKEIDKLYEENKEILEHFDFGKFLKIYVAIKSGFQDRAYERWDDPNGHFIKFKEIYRDDPFYTDSTKVELINNFLFQKEQLYDLKMELSVLSISDSMSSIQKINKPSDYSKIFNEFYKEHKTTLENIRKEQTKVFDYRKMNKFVKQYYDLLKKKVEETNIYDPLLNQNIESMTQVANELHTLLLIPKEDLTKVEKDKIKQKKDYVGFAVKRKTIDGELTYIIDEDRIKKEAEKHTVSAIERFINKNTQKVSKILENREDLEKIIINILFEKKTVQGKINFIFKNGDKFLVLNQLVLVIYSDGKRSYRMPTTFHDVTKDNKSQKKTSQEWMIENF